MMKQIDSMILMITGVAQGEEGLRGWGSPASCWLHSAIQSLQA